MIPFDIDSWGGSLDLEGNDMKSIRVSQLERPYEVRIIAFERADGHPGAVGDLVDGEGFKADVDKHGACGLQNALEALATARLRWPTPPQAAGQPQGAGQAQAADRPQNGQPQTAGQPASFQPQASHRNQLTCMSWELRFTS